MDDIIISALPPDRLEEWLGFLNRDIFPDDPEEAVRSIWESDRKKDMNGIIVAFDRDGRIVGSFKAECRMLWIAGHDVFGGIVSGVGVKDTYRGQGIARRLIDAGHRYLKEQGAFVSHLYSRADTLCLYRRFGYRELPVRQGEDFYRMYRLIQPLSIVDRNVTDTDGLMDVLREG